VRRIGQTLGVLGSLALAGYLLAVVLPGMLGISWRDTSIELAGIPRWDIVCLVGVWAAGLWTHTILLRRSLPGLTRRRAFALNLGGSSVSNVLPFGGAAGIGLNYAMLRSWGYNRVQIGAFATVSNLVVALVKVVIAITGVVALTFMPDIASQLSRPTSPGGIAMMSVVGLVVVAAAILGARWRHGERKSRLAEGFRQVWVQCAHVLRRGWRGLAVGGLGYPLLQIVLLWSCLVALQVHVSIGAVVAAYAIERLLTLVPLTPGGVGVVETSATAVLMGFGAAAGDAFAGVVLFRVFSYLIEIPLGAVVTAAWFARRNRGPGALAA
jgi:uncharacterized membrane protein YbhN (UPF0104 family)